MICEPHPEHVAWLDGAFVPWREANVHVSAHHYGVGVFEGIRAYVGEQGVALFRLRDHMDRLFRSSQILGIRIPAAYDQELLSRVSLELVQKNGLGDAYLRPFVFYDGTAGLSLHTSGLTVRVAVLALAWKDDGAHLDPAARTRGVTLRTSSFIRHHPSALLSKAKANGNYMNSILALAEARACGADEALLLDHNGLATEATGANLFIVRGGALYTPPAASVLDGITRQTILSLAAGMGIEASERRLARDDIYVADEVFLTGTAAEVTPVREVDGRRIGSGVPGLITGKLQALYGAYVRGRTDPARDWLTWVEAPANFS